MTQSKHRMLIGEDADIRSTIAAEDGTTRTMLHFARLADLMIGYYREERFEHVGGKPFLVLTSE